MALPYPTREPFIANTDREWFDFLASRGVDGRVDEVNFWLPRATTPMKAMLPGEPVFFRLKRPDYAIAGYGFFAHFECLDLHTTWATFGWKNGDPDKRRSNHVQNGLLLTKEFHALFDEGYVAVTPDYEVRVSDRLRADWNNGRRYYPYDKQRLIHLPNEPQLQPSRDALAWHLEHVFLKAG